MTYVSKDRLGVDKTLRIPNDPEGLEFASLNGIRNDNLPVGLCWAISSVSYIKVIKISTLRHPSG